MPCEECKRHLNQNLKSMPLSDVSLSNRDNLFLWSYRLHDLVNKQLHKKSPYYLPLANYYSTCESSFWGPCFWRMIHSCAAGYRPEYKNIFKQFIYSLPGVLPCKQAQARFIQCLNKIPLSDEYLKDAQNLFLWTFLIHDLVNRQLGKMSPSYESVKGHYFTEKMCASC